MPTTVTYRPATVEDAPVILQFIKELADHEGMLNEVVATEETLQQTMFGVTPKAHAVLAEIDEKPVGFGLYFYSFSTFLGKPYIYIEDLYVQPAYRGRGIGKGFFKQLAQKALEEDCSRIEWQVLDSNESGIRFYRTLGAIPLDAWTKQRLTRPQIETLAKS